MYLIELLLPLTDNTGRRFEPEQFSRVRGVLVDRFGGVTAHAQAPAQGLWEDAEGQIRRDQVLVFEVMSEELDREWWNNYRQALEREFAQEELVIRAIRIERL